MPSLGHQLSADLDESRARARSDVDQMWTNGDADIIEFPTEAEENEELPAETDRGRYWIRTSDLCRVKSEEPVRRAGSKLDAGVGLSSPRS